LCGARRLFTPLCQRAFRCANADVRDVIFELGVTMPSEPVVPESMKPDREARGGAQAEQNDQNGPSHDYLLSAFQQWP
jgi:hypothetical protein